jgi:hypothetical protein
MSTINKQEVLSAFVSTVEGSFVFPTTEDNPVLLAELQAAIDCENEQNEIAEQQEASITRAQVQHALLSITLPQVKHALVRAQTARGYGNGIDISHADIRAGLKFWERGSQAMLDYTAQNVPDVAAFLAGFGALPVKPVKRMSQFLYLLSTGDLNRGLYRTLALEVLGAGCAGATSRAALTFAATGKGDENTSDLVRDVSLVQKLHRAIGRVGSGTEPTQNSNSFGVNGFAKLLGLARMVKDGDKSRELTVNRESPFYRDLRNIIAKASDATLALALSK